MLESRNLTGSSTSLSATKSLLNGFTTAGYSPIASMGAPAIAKSTLSGAMTAGDLIDLINESGSAGSLSQLSFRNSGGSTTKTLRVVITVDGTPIYDVTSAAVGSGAGVFLAGYRGASDAPERLPDITYTNSIRVQFASSVSESNGYAGFIVRNQVT